MAEPAPEFDCRQCGLPLILMQPGGSPVGYYRCPRCDRQIATSYGEALRHTARPHATANDRAQAELRDSELRGVRERLDRWLAKAEGNDPFLTLGLRPNASLAEARERFHDLALQHHPDRGGNAEQMRRLIEAYDVVRDRLSKAARSGPPEAPRPAPRPTGLVKRKPESWSRARPRSTATNIEEL
jgi:hypothetical protein